jgi:two-component system, OmpR family, heavy metal sensor histidine kinase CusS
MFWKNAEGLRAAGSRPWSMATALTVYFTTAVFILLVVAALFLYSGLETSVERGNRGRLEHRVRVLALLIQEQPSNHAGIEQEVRDEARVSAQSQSPFFLRVLDGENRVVTETPGMTPALPPSLFPIATNSQSQARRWRDADATSYLLDSIVVPAGTVASRGWRIQAALNISGGERLLATYRRDIAVVLVIGLLIAAPLGAWITRRGLRPITEITRAAERIGVQQLEQRIGAGSWPHELRAPAEAFDRMLERLQAAFQRLSQFSADLAHELRTPLNNLMGEAQVALSRDRGAPEYVRVLQSALEEQARLARMIDSMLFLAQAEQGKSVLEPCVLDAHAEMRAVADFYQALAEEQGVQLSCEGEGKVIAEPLLLRRALSNLLSNALKYTGRGGRVMMRVIAAEDDSVTLSVIDTGVGIAGQHLPKLGDRFYRVDPSRTGGGGAGLGLAIVRSIMALHDGKLSIESSEGMGTTASLIFAGNLP